MISIIVITHGQFGQELLRTAQDIAGRQESVAALSVTPEIGPQDLCRALRDALERMRSPEGALVLVDMLGGTPCNTALLEAKDTPVEVLTGVNLYMILSSFTNRGKLDLKALSVKVAEDGKRAIVSAKDLLMKKLSS